MASSLVELNALLDSFVPLSRKVSMAEIEVREKEAEALEKILARVWMVMPFLHDCHIINRRKMLKCQCNVDVEYNNLQARIKNVDSLLPVLEYSAEPEPLLGKRITPEGERLLAEGKP